MNDPKNHYLSRYDELIKIADKIQETYKKEPGAVIGTSYIDMLEPIPIIGEPFEKVDAEMYGGWLNSGLDLIQLTLGKERSYYESFNTYHSSFLSNQYPSYKSFKLSLAVLKAARKAYEHDLQSSNRETPETVKSDKVLRLVLTQLFNAQELRALCFDFGFDPEEVPINETGKSDLVINLIKYAQREQRMGELLKLINIAKPQLKDMGLWED
ncbi:MAG: hypothetical protein KC421_03685 [Anaerolineales bacterium]|nr:hypothetical protein [Anaerolineales bacterium]